MELQISTCNSFEMTHYKDKDRDDPFLETVNHLREFKADTSTKKLDDGTK